MTENITRKTTIDGLTIYKVSILTQNYIKIGEKEYPAEEPKRIAFENIKRGRTELGQNIEEPYLSAIMAVWGNEPTVVLPEPENIQNSEQV